MIAEYKKHTLQFKRPAGTSRGILEEKTSWFIKLSNKTNPSVYGIGECGVLAGLSVDDRPDYEQKLSECCHFINQGGETEELDLLDWPSIRFGFEMALRDLEQGGSRTFWKNDFSGGKEGIPINGLVWMGDVDFMQQQIEQKLSQGFDCIKMKIGAIDFEEEFALLQAIRLRYSPSEITLRVDANGAFQPDEAMNTLKRLAELDIHSIEQPIKAGQIDAMRQICDHSPLSVALDEELIGVNRIEDKEKLLDAITPPYIILKPSLLGGFEATDEWVKLADERNIGWWTTSALESNIGLNAIAQYTFERNNGMLHGLGTGSLYTNNFSSPLVIEDGHIWSKPDMSWDHSSLF